MFKKINIMTSLAAVALASGVASAEPMEGDLRTVNVDHRDLDLSTQLGRATLDRRLHLAVNAVCGRVERGDPMRASVVACRQRAELAAGSNARFAVAAAERKNVQIAGR